MTIKKILTYFGLLFLLVALNACQNLKKYDKPFKHNTPLIKNKDIVSSGQSEIAKTLEMGPKPCLLYTSPSPRDKTVSRMPSSA